MRRPCTKKDAPAKQRGIWRKKFYKLKNADKATFCPSIEARVMPVPTSKRPKEREFVVDSRASMHMMSKNRFKLRRDGDSAKIHAHHNGGNGPWKNAYTNEEAQVHVHDLDLFVTVQILDDTPADLSLGNSARNTDTPMSGPAVKKPRLTKQGKIFFFAKRKTSYLLLSLDCRQILVPVRPLRRHRRTRQVHLQVQHPMSG